MTDDLISQLMNISHQLTDDQYIVTHRVGPVESGLRIDTFLKTKYQKRSRERIKKSIEEGSVHIERENFSYHPLGKLKASSPIIEGDLIQICTNRKEEPPVSFDFKVLYEDDSVLVIDKPANLPVHPAGKYFFNTLLIYLKTQYRKTNRSNLEYYLVHRIDRETSGALILSKKKSICEHFIENFKLRKIKKTYLALAHGCPPSTLPIPLIVKIPLGSAKDSKIRLKVGPRKETEGGQSAETHFYPLQSFTNASGKKFTFWECRPKTGRQHQIRVHLFEAGYPIVGDKLYGIDERDAMRFFEPIHIRFRPNIHSKRTGYFFDLPKSLEEHLILDRHALHAWKIKFQHPVTKKDISIQTEIPNDIQSFLSKLTETKKWTHPTGQ